MDAELYDLFSYSGIIDKASEYIEKKLWLRNISKKNLMWNYPIINRTKPHTKLNVLQNTGRFKHIKCYVDH